MSLNLAAPTTSDPAAAQQRDGLSAADLWQRSDFDLHTLIKGSAMTYLPLSRLRRNIATVVGNAGDPDLSDVLDQPGRGVRNAARSTLSPVVADAVTWAKGRLKEVTRSIEVAVATLLLWTAMPAAAQTPPPVSDVKPAIVVKVPGVRLGAEQVATIVLLRATRNHARVIPSSICCTVAARPHGVCSAAVV